MRPIGGRDLTGCFHRDPILLTQLAQVLIKRFVTGVAPIGRIAA